MTNNDSRGKQEFAAPAFLRAAGTFLLKCIVFTLVLCIGIGVTLKATLSGVTQSGRFQAAMGRIQDRLSSESTRLRLVGFFTTNPQVHFRESQIYEEFGDVKKAYDEIDLAIGLLELNKADTKVLERYQARLAALRKKMGKEAAPASAK